MASPVTVRDRERHYKYLLEFMRKETGEEDIDVGNLLESEEGRDKQSSLIGRFFFSMRVEAADDGTEKLPKRKYAEKIRSSVKCTIQNLYRVDITDPCLFPEASKKWKAFVAELVDHHDKIDPVTVQLIYELMVNVKIALEAIGPLSRRASNHFGAKKVSAAFRFLVNAGCLSIKILRRRKSKGKEAWTNIKTRDKPGRC